VARERKWDDIKRRIEEEELGEEES